MISLRQHIFSLVAVFVALGLDAQVTPRESKPATPEVSRKGWIPARIRLDDCPQLRELAWHVHGTPELTPREALDIYELAARGCEEAVGAGAGVGECADASVGGSAYLSGRITSASNGSCSRWMPRS